MIATRLTKLLGASCPIQLAAMPGVGTPALIAAVASAGGLGMVPAPMQSADALGGVLDDVGRRTTGVVGVNFLMPFLDRTCVEVTARKARLVEFFYGDPDPELVPSRDALASWQVGSLAETIAAEHAGCYRRSRARARTSLRNLAATRSSALPLPPRPHSPADG